MRPYFLVLLSSLAACAGNSSGTGTANDEITGAERSALDAVGTLGDSCSGVLVGSKTVLTSPACAASGGVTFANAKEHLHIVSCKVTGEVGTCTLESEATETIPVRFGDPGTDFAALCAERPGAPVLRLQEGSERVVAIGKSDSCADVVPMTADTRHAIAQAIADSRH